MQVSCIAGRFFTDWATREALMDNFSLIKTTPLLKERWLFPSRILTVLAEEGSCDTEKYHLLWLLQPKQPLPSAAGLTQTLASPSGTKSSSGHRAIRVSRVEWTPSPADNAAEGFVGTECVMPLHSCGSSLTTAAGMILPNHRKKRRPIYRCSGSRPCFPAFKGNKTFLHNNFIL